MTEIEIARRIRSAGGCVVPAGPEFATAQGILPRPAVHTWKVYGPRLQMILAAMPGAGHHAARRLQDGGWLQGVITYGDDVLFEDVGVRDVVAPYGSVGLTVCPDCGYTEPLGCVVDLLPIPGCAACGGVLRPDVVLDGEPPRASAVANARHLIRQAHLLVVAGTVPRDLVPAAGVIDVGRDAPGRRLADIAELLDRARRDKPPS
jgi:NAD-dependent deacetylase